MKFSIYTPSKVVYLFKYKHNLVSLNAAVLYFSIGLNWKTFIHMMCTNVNTYPNNLNLLNKWYECHFRNSVTFALLAVLCGLYPGLFLSCDAGHVHERFFGYFFSLPTEQSTMKENIVFMVNSVLVNFIYLHPHVCIYIYMIVLYAVLCINM